MGWFDICRVNINASSVPHLCSYKIWDLKAWVKYCNRENQLSVSVPKTGPLHFGLGKSFPSNFSH